jgi:dTDP-D-glucose 4,6-dehydratase
MEHGILITVLPVRNEDIMTAILSMTGNHGDQHHPATMIPLMMSTSMIKTRQICVFTIGTKSQK